MRHPSQSLLRPCGLRRGALTLLTPRTKPATYLRDSPAVLQVDQRPPFRRRPDSPPDRAAEQRQSIGQRGEPVLGHLLGLDHDGGVRFLFDCGAVDDERLAAIVVQPEEVSEYRFAALPDALPLLRGPIRRRVRAATKRRALVYLENGRPVPEVGGGPRSQG